MNGSRIAGQVFLWVGFISAALAATSQREFDFLPEGEQAALDKLPAKLILNKEELATVTATPSREMGTLSLAEFEKLIADITPISAKNVAAAAAAKEEAERRQAAGEPDPPETEPEVKIKKITAADFEKSRTGNLENKWPTVPWLWYGLSMAVGLVGVVLLRSTAKSADQEHGKVAQQFETITSSLGILIKNVGTMQSGLGEMSPKQSIDFIDRECAPAFGDFADSRNALIQRFGMQPYAEIMTQFASAERFVNRAWSASADGYMNEAKSSVDRAMAHLNEANGLIAKFETEMTFSRR